MIDPISVLIAAAGSMVKDNIGAILDRAGTLAGSATAELSLKTGQAFTKYYDNSVRALACLKTILYRAEPTFLYDFYVATDLRAGDNSIVDTSSIAELLDHLLTLRASRNQGGAPKLVVTGTAGSGKSTLLRHFFLNAIETKSHLPIHVPLRALNAMAGSISVLGHIYESLARYGFDLDETYFRKLLNTGEFLLLLDGFDELSPAVAAAAADEVLRLSDRYSANSFVVSSRPTEQFVGWNAFDEFSVEPMTKAKCLELVEKLRYDEIVKEEFREEIRERLYESHESFLSNPLLTTLMLMTYDQFGQMPQKMHLFYEQAFDTLFFKHDATKPGFKRVMHTALPADEFQEVLSGVCIQTVLGDQVESTHEEFIRAITDTKKFIFVDTTFSAEAFFRDLKDSLCLIVQDGGRFQFAHRSFQEYFAARFVTRCDSERRRKLLDRLAGGLLSSQVITLAWEQDRRAIEDDFLLPRLKRLSRAVSEREGDVGVELRCLRRWCAGNDGAITMYRDGAQVFDVPNDLGLVIFVEGRYYDDVAEVGEVWRRGAGKRELWWGSIEERLQSEDRGVSVRFGTWSAMEPVSRGPSVEVGIDWLLADELVAPAVVGLLGPMERTLERAVAVVEVIERRRAGQVKSITELLLE